MTSPASVRVPLHGTDSSCRHGVHVTKGQFQMNTSYAEAVMLLKGQWPAKFMKVLGLNKSAADAMVGGKGRTCVCYLVVGG